MALTCCGQLDEALVLDARAGRARDDVEPVVVEQPAPSGSGRRRCRPGSAGRRSISSCLRGLGRVRHTRIVSPIPRESSCSKAMRVLMMPSGGMPASVTPRCSGTSGRASAKRRLASITFRGIGVLQADDVAVEAELVQQAAVLERRADHRRDVVAREARLHLGVDAAAVDADADRAGRARGRPRPGSAPSP